MSLRPNGFLVKDIYKVIRMAKNVGTPLGIDRIKFFIYGFLSVVELSVQK